MLEEMLIKMLILENKMKNTFIKNAKWIKKIVGEINLSISQAVILAGGFGTGWRFADSDFKNYMAKPTKGRNILILFSYWIL